MCVSVLTFVDGSEIMTEIDLRLGGNSSQLDAEARELAAAPGEDLTPPTPSSGLRDGLSKLFA